MERSEKHKPVRTLRRWNIKAAVSLTILVAISFHIAQRVEAMETSKRAVLGEVISASLSGNLHCEILSNTVSHKLELTGIVWSTDQAVGNYSFIVQKNGVSGTSNLAQSGMFEVEPDDKRVVGYVMVDAAKGNKYLARLTVRSGEEESVCDVQLN